MSALKNKRGGQVCVEFKGENMYTFNVRVLEKDYYEFNKFVSLKSPHGKKQMLGLRILLVVITLALCVLSVCSYGFTEDALLDSIAYVITFGIAQALLVPLMKGLIKLQIRFVRKNGKMPYSAQAVMTFDEESFTETTEENKTEVKYSAVESISVREGYYLYLHMNSLMAYLLPYASFEDKTQYKEFLTFLKEKVSTVNFYEEEK